MDTVTYPTPAVEQFLSEHFHALRVNVREPQTGAIRELLRATKPQWAPTFVFLDRAIELRRYTGWLPPADFLAELKFVLGLDDLLRQRFDDATRRFRAAADDDPSVSVAAEALYWAGVAGYKMGGVEALREGWAELTTRFPESTWAKRADIFDVTMNDDR